MALRKDFLYGFATASAQIEGGGPESEKESGRGMSVGPRWAGIELESILIVARFTFSLTPRLRTSRLACPFFGMNDGPDSLGTLVDLGRLLQHPRQDQRWLTGEQDL